MEEFLMTGKNCGREAINDDGEKIFPENEVQQDRKKIKMTHISLTFDS
jgi:hypothetical protein